jgi:hypothetical protein
MLLGLPMLGVYLSGLPVIRYLSFPPKTHYIEHAPFSWSIFSIFAATIILFILPVIRLFKWERKSLKKDPAVRAVFPWWGWVGILLGLFSWTLAWNRFAWFTAIQPHIFTPLWLSYIMVINALSYRRTGKCLLINHLNFFLLLFPVSALFWWFFEYLNRFVQNWYYVGAFFDAWEYFWFATLPFSTVLPAVWSTKEWIGSKFQIMPLPGKTTRFSRINSRRSHWAILILSAAGLTAIGIFPDYLFPLLWVSPLLIIVSLQSIMGESHIFSSGSGNYHQVVSAALAAVMCGFFWEMWNYFSLAKWEYSIPFVQRFQIFEMPVLGYAGYLPFGLECLAVGQMVKGLVER